MMRSSPASPVSSSSERLSWRCWKNSRTDSPFTLPRCLSGTSPRISGSRRSAPGYDRAAAGVAYPAWTGPDQRGAGVGGGRVRDHRRATGDEGADLHGVEAVVVLEDDVGGIDA